VRAWCKLAMHRSSGCIDLSLGGRDSARFETDTAPRDSRAYAASLIGSRRRCSRSARETIRSIDRPYCFRACRVPRRARDARVVVKRNGRVVRDKRKCGLRERGGGASYGRNERRWYGSVTGISRAHTGCLDGKDGKDAKARRERRREIRRVRREVCP